MGTGGRPDFGLRPDFGFRPKLGPQKADLSNFDTKMHSATRRVFWDASRRRRSHPEAETAEIRRPLWLQPRVVRRAGFRILFLSKRVPGGLRPVEGCPVLVHIPSVFRPKMAPRWLPGRPKTAKMAHHVAIWSPIWP